MRDFIAKNNNGFIVGKWRQHGQPYPDDGLEIIEVDDVNNYEVDYWWDEEH